MSPDFFWNLFLLAYRHISECIDSYRCHIVSQAFNGNGDHLENARSFFGCRICLSCLAGSDASGSKGNGKRMMQLLIQRRERYICIYVISRLSLEYASTCLYQRTTCRRNRSSVQAGINRVVVTSSIAAVGPPMKWMEAWFLTSEAVNFVLTQPLSTLREWAPSMGCAKLDVQLVIGCKCVTEGRRWWQGQGLRLSRCWNVHLWLQLQHWSFVIIEFDNLIRS